MQKFLYIVATKRVISFWTEKNKNSSDGHVYMRFYLILTFWNNTNDPLLEVVIF